MSKKILSLVLFLISALAVSCSNADKTGSGDNNSGSTTPQGIAKYEGTWQLTDDEKLTTILTISNNGAVTYYGGTSTNVANNRNETYEVKFVDKNGPAGPGGILTLTLTFNNDTSGTFSNSDGPKGNMTKQKNN